MGGIGRIRRIGLHRPPSATAPPMRATGRGPPRAGASAAPAGTSFPCLSWARARSGCWDLIRRGSANPGRSYPLQAAGTRTGCSDTKEPRVPSGLWLGMEGDAQRIRGQSKRFDIRDPPFHFAVDIDEQPYHLFFKTPEPSHQAGPGAHPIEPARPAAGKKARKECQKLLTDPLSPIRDRRGCCAR
jgi:hypothetical protein